MNHIFVLLIMHSRLVSFKQLNCEKTGYLVPRFVQNIWIFLELFTAELVEPKSSNLFPNAFQNSHLKSRSSGAIFSQ